MPNKLYLIIDPSDAFLRSKTQDIYTEWGFKRANVKELTEWQFIPTAPSMFGDRMMTHLDLTGKGDMKKFVDFFTDRKFMKNFEDKWWGNGTIITATTAQGAKKIENLVNKAGGVVIKKEKSNVRKRELLSSLSLRVDVKNAVTEFVGEDYDLMLSFVNEVSKLDKNEQKALTIEQAFSYFPPTPGSVLPWEYLNALIDGDTGKSVELFTRTVINTHVLVCLVFITKKMQLLYRVRVSMEDGLKTDKQIAAATGEKAGWELSNMVRLAKRVSLKNAERIAFLTNKLESDIKGGSQVNPNTLFLATLTQVGMLLGNTQ